MRHRIKIVAALAALAFSPAMAQAQGVAVAGTRTGTSDAQAMTLAHAIVDAAFPPERRQEMMDKLMRTMGDQMKSALPAAFMRDPGLARIMSNYVANLPTTLRPATQAFLPRQMEAVAQAYARMFTVAELTDIATFARTPSGKRYLERSMDVMSDPAVAAVNTTYFAEASKLSQASMAGFSREIAEYMKQHPDVARALANDIVIPPAK